MHRYSWNKCPGVYDNEIHTELLGHVTGWMRLSEIKLVIDDDVMGGTTCMSVTLARPQMAISNALSIRVGKIPGTNLPHATNSAADPISYGLPWCRMIISDVIVTARNNAQRLWFNCAAGRANNGIALYCSVANGCTALMCHIAAPWFLLLLKESFSTKKTGGTSQEI